MQEIQCPILDFPEVAGTRQRREHHDGQDCVDSESDFLRC